MVSSIPEEAGSPTNKNLRATTAQKLYSSRRVKSFDLYSSKKQKISFTCRKFQLNEKKIFDSRNDSFIKNASKIAIKEVVDTLIQGEESSQDSENGQF